MVNGLLSQLRLGRRDGLHQATRVLNEDPAQDCPVLYSLLQYFFKAQIEETDRITFQWNCTLLFMISHDKNNDSLIDHMLNYFTHDMPLFHWGRDTCTELSLDQM